MGIVYTMFNNASKAWNKVLMFSLKRDFAECGSDVSIGRHSEIAGAENIHLGNHVYLGPGLTVYTTRACLHIGEWVMSGPNLTIITGDHRSDVTDRPMMSIGEDEKLPENDIDVVIGDDVWLGSGVTILKGVNIASHCIVAAGAVVTKDIEPEFSIWGGVPARCLGTRANAPEEVD